MGGEAKAGKSPGWALETYSIETSLSFFELEIRQNVSQVERNILTRFQLKGRSFYGREAGFKPINE